MNEDFLIHNRFIKHGMEIISHPELLAFKEHFPDAERKTGGSASNVIKGLKNLGWAAQLIGKVGNDEPGTYYRNAMKELGIEPLLLPSEKPTSEALSFITPDGERTFRTYLGASLDLKGEDLKTSDFHKALITHVEGYALSCGDAARRAMALSSSPISFDLSNFHIVNQHREEMKSLLSEYVDIVFANEREAIELEGLKPEEACYSLQKIVPVAVVTLSEKGCFVGNQDNVHFIPAFPVKALDTTGAGDIFMSAFIHGYLLNKNLEVCAQYGHLAAKEVVQVVGADLSSEAWKSIASSF